MEREASAIRLLDNVIIGSGAQIIGLITIGSRARIGANAVVMEDVLLVQQWSAFVPDPR